MRDESEAPGPESQMGGFRYVARTDRWEWSDEVARMYGYEPGAVIPTTELVLAHQHPKERARVAYLIEQVRRHGAPFSGRHRIIDTRGHEHIVVVAGDRFYEGWAPDGVAGFFVDITEQFNADVQERLSEAVTAISARRAVINQAIGMLMLRYGLSADSALRLLKRLSQESNIKLRVIARRVVVNAAARAAIPENLADRVDTLLRVGGVR